MTHWGHEYLKVVKLTCDLDSYDESSDRPKSRSNPVHTATLPDHKEIIYAINVKRNRIRSNFGTSITDNHG